MREIKFRGKCLDDGKWVYGDYHHRVGGVHCIIDIQPDFQGKVEYVIIQVDAETIGQFTGLRDKNNKEIYEGDIISHKYTNGPQCCFPEGKEEINYIGFRQSECKFIVVCANRHHDLYEPYNIHIEVIGNIYDNPELLKSL